jgi:hypothetical protein
MMLPNTWHSRRSTLSPAPAAIVVVASGLIVHNAGYATRDGSDSCPFSAARKPTDSSARAGATGDNAD